VIGLYHIIAIAISALKVQIARKSVTIKGHGSATGGTETTFGTVHEIFEAKALDFAGRVAVISEGEPVTYRELDERANQLAHFLRAHGLGRGSLVGILLPRSLDAYVAILGVLKSGAAYVPIDPDYPVERISYILENSNATCLITKSSLSSPGSFRGLIVQLDSENGSIENQSRTRLEHTAVGVRSHDLCYVIYTSGSTGRPKGVAVEHRNLCNLISGEQQIFQVKPTDRVCQIASLSFDLSVEEMWLAYGAGATLVPAPANVLRGGPGLGKFLSDHQVTILSCVPTLLSMLEEEAPSLRLLILGGEACPPSLVARWARPGLRLVNSYGPTETTITATCCDLTVGRPITIGRPLPGYNVRILDEFLTPVRQGDIGEICIGGKGVSRGYIGLPEETRRTFVADQFASDDLDARIYRTGDLGRFDPEGNIEFKGRKDGQIKLRGYRIELEEIETALMSDENVLAAACALREDDANLQQLVGYVVPKQGTSVDCEVLRLRLLEKLPLFMVPGVIES